MTESSFIHFQLRHVLTFSNETDIDGTDCQLQCNDTSTHVGLKDGSVGPVSHFWIGNVGTGFTLCIVVMIVVVVVGIIIVVVVVVIA